MRIGIIALAAWLVGGMTVRAEPVVTDRDSISYLQNRRNSDGGYAPAQAPSDKPLGGLWIQVRIPLAAVE